MQLFGYQQDAVDEIYESWKHVRSTLAVLPTGAGKTVIASSILSAHRGQGVAIAHRKELVGQMSQTLARFGVSHQVIGQPPLIRWITQNHLAEFGREYVRPGSPLSVVGVDTLLSQAKNLGGWLQQQTLCFQDEAHHLLRENKWGRAFDLMPNAKLLGVTATPERADGKGLGAHAHGVFDHMVIGPTMRDLIDLGRLAEYEIYAPPSDINLEGVSISKATGDFSKNQLVNRVHESHIVGDVVEHYVRLALGKQAVVFVTDLDTAAGVAANFVGSGIKAAVVSSKNNDRDRSNLIDQFKRGELQVLINVDLFGEGFDVSAIEVVIFARPTASYAVYAPQFGRALRVLAGKDKAIIIDHVGNVVKHGLPDSPRAWTLDAREKRKAKERDPDLIPLTNCPACTRVYEKVYPSCPYCGHSPVPLIRSGPEFVDGDLVLLDADTLADMRKDIEAVDKSPATIFSKLKHGGAHDLAAQGAAKQQRLRYEMQTQLRGSISLLAGYHRADGMGDREIHRRFYFRYGVDVRTAQALGRREAEELMTKINQDIMRRAA